MTQERVSPEIAEGKFSVPSLYKTIEDNDIYEIWNNQLRFNQDDGIIYYDRILQPSEAHTSE